jgi:hypothetical protein
LQAERYAQGVKRFEFDASLAPYDLRSYNRWRELSCYVTAEVIDAVQPLSGGSGGCAFCSLRPGPQLYCFVAIARACMV